MLIIAFFAAGKVNSPYKKVGPCGKPYPGDFHLQDENHSHPQLLHQPHQLQYKPANKKNHTAVFLAVAVLTLVIAVVSITVQVILFKEYNDLKAEVELQMQMLETMKRQEDVTPQTVQEVIETNLEIIEQLDGHEHEGNDVLRRKKRSDDPRRNRNSNRRRKFIPILRYHMLGSMFPTLTDIWGQNFGNRVYIGETN